MTDARIPDLKPPNWAQPVYDDLRELLITTRRLRCATMQYFREDDTVTREVEDIWLEAKRLAEHLKERRDTFPT